MVEQRFGNIKKGIKRAGEAISNAAPSPDKLNPEQRAEKEHRAINDYSATGSALTPAELRRLLGR